MDYERMGSKIRYCRLQNKMTQEKLAEKVGLSASYLGHLERGTRIASMNTFVALCRELHVSPQYLLADSLAPDFHDDYNDDLKGEREKVLHLLELAIRIVERSK